MRPMKNLASIMLLACLPLMCGCGKSFFYSFQEEQSLDNGEVKWQVLGNGSYAIRPGGISLDDKMLLCPFAFKGDATLKINIALDYESSGYVQFLIFISKGPSVIPEAFHVMTFYVASPTNQGVVISEKDTSKKEHVNILGIIPGINKSGDNELILEKKGDHYKYTLNGVLLGEYTAELFFTDWFFVQMVGILGNGTAVDIMVIKDFTALCSGQMQEL
jgi:hypothetical protein